MAGGEINWGFIRERTKKKKITTISEKRKLLERSRLGKRGGKRQNNMLKKGTKGIDSSRLGTVYGGGKVLRTEPFTGSFWVGKNQGGNL